MRVCYSGTHHGEVAEWQTQRIQNPPGIPREGSSPSFATKAENSRAVLLANDGALARIADGCSSVALSPNAHELSSDELERAIVAATLAGNHEVAALLASKLKNLARGTARADSSDEGAAAN